MRTNKPIVVDLSCGHTRHWFENKPELGEILYCRSCGLESDPVTVVGITDAGITEILETKDWLAACKDCGWHYQNRLEINAQVRAYNHWRTHGHLVCYHRPNGAGLKTFGNRPRSTA